MFFFILPVGVDYRTRRFPIVTFVIMGLCVLVYFVGLALEWAYGEAVTAWMYEYLWLIPARGRWWTFVTSVFCHGGFFHLLGNMVYLFLFGACVEDHIGRVRFTLLYLLGGVVACLAHIAGEPGHFASEIPLGGASGAVSACIGGFVLLLARTEIEFKWLFFFLFRIWTGEFHLPAWLVISFWFAKDLFWAVVRLTAGEGGGGVAFAAHVGGFLAGFAWVFLERPRLRRLAEAEQAEAEWEAAQALRARYRVAPGHRMPPEPSAEPSSIYLHAAGEQFGPFTLDQVQAMFATRQVGPETLYWQEGMEEWRSVEELRPPGTTEG